MSCLTCESFDLANREMAKVGFGHCKHTIAGSFFSVRHEQCEKFKSAAPDIAAKRMAWVNQGKGSCQ